MNSKILFVLFITIFYNGVTCASVFNKSIREEPHLEEKASTVSPPLLDHTSKKIETTPAPVTIVVTKKETSAPLNHSEKPTVENATVHSDANNNNDNKTIPTPHEINAKNSTQDQSVKNVTQPIDNKNVNQINETKNETAPVDVHPNKNSSSVTLAPNVHENSKTTVTPVVPTKTSIITTTTTNSTNSTEIKTTPATKSDATTVSPNSITSDKSLVEPAPVTERHFSGASFVGGIVLTLGLTAIGFIAFKYYKSGKIDMNYRTL